MLRRTLCHCRITFTYCGKDKMDLLARSDGPSVTPIVGNPDLHRAGRRPLARRRALDLMLVGFLPARARALPAVPGEARSGALCRAASAFFGDHTPLAERHAFAAHLAPLRKIEWVV